MLAQPGGLSLAACLPACLPALHATRPSSPSRCSERDRLYERAERVGALLSHLGEQLKEAIADVNDSTCEAPPRCCPLRCCLPCAPAPPGSARACTSFAACRAGRGRACTAQQLQLGGWACSTPLPVWRTHAPHHS